MEPVSHNDEIPTSYPSLTYPGTNYIPEGTFTGPSYVHFESNSDILYDLLLARLRAVEAEIAALREQLQELADDLHETWLGGTE